MTYNRGSQIKRHDIKIPEYTPSFEEYSRQMQVNCEFIKAEITNHVDSEIERFAQTIKRILEPGYFDD